MRKYKTIFFLLIMSIQFYPACETDYYIPEETDIPDSVSFTADIMPIFNAGCNLSGCHAAGGYIPYLNEENAYMNLMAYGLVDTTAPESSILYQRLTSDTNPMPPDGKLEPGKIELILAWIRQGAPAKK